MDVTIAWTASLLLVGLAEALLALIITRLPSTADEGLRYVEKIIGPSQVLLSTAGASLLVSVGFTWKYAVIEAQTAQWYVLSVALTLLTGLIYGFAARIIWDFFVEWMRGLIKESS